MHTFIVKYVYNQSLRSFPSYCRKISHIMSEPPAKKQKSIADYFGSRSLRSNHKKLPTDSEDCVVVKVETGKGKAKMTDSVRSKALEAAEKRKVAKSPDVTPAEFSPWDKNMEDVSLTGSSGSKAESGGAKGGGASPTKTGPSGRGRGAKADNENGAGPSKPGPSSEADTGSTEATLQMSPDLFTDSEPSEFDSQDFDSDICAIESKKPSKRREGSNAAKGMPLNMLNKSTRFMDTLPPLTPSDSHTVLFKTPHTFSTKRPPCPWPNSYKDKWDGDHVRMPCSNQNEYPVKGKTGKSAVRRRWEVVEEALCKPIPGPYELAECILQYNTRYSDRWDFAALIFFFTDEITEKERNYCFQHTIPSMAQLILKLPHLCTQAIPMLKKGRSHTLTMSQEQIACLLANAFFCTFPRRNAKQKHSEYANYPSINFNTLFHGQPTQRKLEKLKCLLHYFRRVTEKVPTGTVTFKRQCINNIPHWDNLETKLKGLHVSSEGTIEDDGVGMLQADFANKYIGGGVLTHGCVQEEIRFLICPEMLITRLFTEVLDPNEAVIMTGCERFSDYDGYADTFTWKGDYNDQTTRDKWGRIGTEVVAIDALVIHQYSRQFLPFLLKRELTKAYCGFVVPGSKPTANLPAVCTGNWGCGAFGGDKRLKALIQLMAAAEAKRDVCYFTFDDVHVRDDLFQIHDYLTGDNPLGVGNILTVIEQYRLNVVQKCKKGKPRMNLYEYIIRVFDGTLENTDSEPEPDYPQDSPEMMYWEESGDVSKAAAADSVDVTWDDEPQDTAANSAKKTKSDDEKK